MTSYFAGPQQNLLEHGVGDAVLYHYLAVRYLTAVVIPELGLGQRDVAEFLAGELVAPSTESALGELHDVALVHQSDAGTTALESIANRLANEPLGAVCRHRLDANSAPWTYLGIKLGAHELDCSVRLLAPRLPLDTRIDVLGILPEDHHVELFRLAHRRWCAAVVLHRPYAGIQVEPLAQCHVEAAHAAPHRRSHRSLDRYSVMADGVERALRQPFTNFGMRFPARQKFHPGNSARAAIRVGDGTIEHVARRHPNIRPDPVAFHPADDRLIGDDQSILTVELDADALGRRRVAVGGHLGLL